MRWQITVIGVRKEGKRFRRQEGIVTWSHSNATFAIALPTERTETVLHGLCEAFDFFAAVPKEL